MATNLTEGAQIINESLRALGYDFRIDTTSASTITEGLEKIGAFPPSQLNTIMEQMNLIIQQRNYGTMFDATKNKFRAFLIDMERTGFGVEDIYHEIIAGVLPYWDKNYTPEEIVKNLVSYDAGKIAKKFHTEKYEKQYSTIVDTRNYDKVFTPYGVTRFIDTRLANLAWSAEIELMQEIVGIVKQMIADQKIVFRNNNNVNTLQGIRNTVESIKATIGGFLTPCDLYNHGVEEDDGTYRKLVSVSNSMDDIFIITTPENMERLKVQGYANAFNLSQFELEGRIIYAPAGTDFGVDDIGGTVLYIVLDRRAIVMGIMRWLGSSFFIPNTHYTKHWLTVEGVKGYNTFFNAVAFGGDPIDDVTE